MLRNKIKHALREGGAAFGTGLTGPVDLPTLRVLAGEGVEWLFFDLEHGSLEIGDLLDAVQIADMLGMCSVLRIPDLSYQWVARSLDTGALSVMIPRVETREQAELAVQWAKFPPVGRRGMGSPSYLSYAPVPVAEGIEISNRETMVVLQIETKAGADNVESIASVPGVDVLFLGPLDMSISLDRAGDVTHEEEHAIFHEVCGVARDHGLGVGIVCSAGQSRFYYDMGVRMFSMGTALTYLRAGVRAAVTEFQKQVP